MAGFSVFDPTDSPATTSPLRLPAWQDMLEDYPDPALSRSISGMIQHGAKLGYSGSLLDTARPSASVRNLPMSNVELQHVRHSVSERVRKGQSRTVLPEESFLVVFSPIGAVPKHGGKHRTINHLSWPRRDPASSVNGGINIDSIPMSYDGLGLVFADIRDAHADNRPVELWKADLTDAFYHLVVAARDARLLGFHLDGVKYLDLTLNFGGRSSPFLFNILAEALHWICESLGLRLSHYLDDSFGICPAGTGTRCLELFRAVCGELGIAVSPSKTVSGRQLEVLGILIDCDTARAWLTEEKRARLILDIDGLLDDHFASTARLQSIAGSLVFVTQVCPGGRAFLRRIFDATKADAGAHAWISSSLRDELRWWRTQIRDWDGCMILHHTLLGAEVWSDAASTLGLGGHLGPKASCSAAFAARIPTRHQGKDIMFLEALALLTALRRWSTDLADREVTCYVDNTVLASAIRSGSCRHHPTQTIIREIFGLAMAAHMTLVPQWIPSAENDLADALSRFDNDAIQSRYPHVLAFTTLPSSSPSATTSSAP